MNSIFFNIFTLLYIRYGKANHPGIDGYDEREQQQHLIYLDANNLYGWAMSQHLPLSDFKWLSREEINHLDVSAIADDSNHGYILEVDLGKYI